MIAPEEKAIKLFESMKGFRVKHKHSINCAIKATEEIISIARPDVFTAGDHQKSDLEYWMEVKEHLLTIKSSL